MERAERSLKDAIFDKWVNEGCEVRDRSLRSVYEPKLYPVGRPAVFTSRNFKRFVAPQYIPAETSPSWSEPTRQHTVDSTWWCVHRLALVLCTVSEGGPGAGVAFGMPAGPRGHHQGPGYDQHVRTVPPPRGGRWMQQPKSSVRYPRADLLHLWSRGADGAAEAARGAGGGGPPAGGVDLAGGRARVAGAQGGLRRRLHHRGARR
eukprot:4286011-Pyramimonas_sp.AAC.1